MKILRGLVTKNLHMTNKSHVIESFDNLKQGIRTLIPTALYNHKFNVKIDNLEEAIKDIVEPVDVGHDLLLNQIKALEKLQDFLDNIENKDIVISGTNEDIFKSAIKTIQKSSFALSGIMNLLGAIHDSYHAVNKNDC